MTHRMKNPFLMAMLLGGIEVMLYYIIRFLVGPRRQEFIALADEWDTAHDVSGVELMRHAQDIVLVALREGPDEGMTNSEIGAATGLNPTLNEGRKGEVTRSILQSLTEIGIVRKDGQRYLLAQ